MPSLDLYVGSKTDAEIAAALPLCVRCGRRHFASYHHEGQCSYQFEDGTFCPEDALRLDGRGRYDVTGKKFAAHCAAHRLSRSEQDPYEEAAERNREYEANERERMRQLRSFQVVPVRPSLSEIMRAYNSARRLAKEGYLDRARLNRALGVLMRKEPRPYHTNVEDCDCPDKVGRRAQGIVCKHQIAAVIRQIASEAKRGN